MSMPTSDGTARRALLMGHRESMGPAMRSLGVPYVLWCEREPKRPPADAKVHVAPFGGSAAESRRRAEALLEDGPFTHVIACTEGSVVAASHARRVLGARISKHTTVRRCHDKLAMKTELKRAGVPMTDFVDGNLERDWGKLGRRLGFPLVVKNRTSAGGMGIDIVSRGGEPEVSLRNRMVERFVEAPEASVESLVVDGSIVFENVTEYYRKRHVNIVPAPPNVDASGGIRGVSRRAISALRIAWGMTHAEAFLCADGPLFGEIAMRPPGGYIMDLLGLAYGFDAWRAFASVELELAVELPSAAVSHAAAVLLHPGRGRITAISGLAAIREHPHVVRARLGARVGQTVDVRRSVGATLGHVLLQAPDRASLLAAIADVDATLRIEMEA